MFSSLVHCKLIGKYVQVTCYRGSMRYAGIVVAAHITAIELKGPSDKIILIPWGNIEAIVQE